MDTPSGGYEPGLTTLGHSDKMRLSQKISEDTYGINFGGPTISWQPPHTSNTSALVCKSRIETFSPRGDQQPPWGGGHKVASSCSVTLVEKGTPFLRSTMFSWESTQQNGKMRATEQHCQPIKLVRTVIMRPFVWEYKNPPNFCLPSQPLRGDRRGMQRERSDWILMMFPVRKTHRDRS